MRRKHTIGSAFKLNITRLKRQEALVEGRAINGNIEWSTNGSKSSIYFETNYEDPDKIYLRLAFKICRNEKWKRIDQDIEIVEATSNLRKGKLLFFLCPITGERCRNLYRAYGFDEWISRKAYTLLNKRLYYPIQLESAYWRPNTRYHQLNRILYEQRDTRRRALNYAGKETRRFKQREKLFNQYCKVEAEKERLFVAAYNRRFPGMLP